MYGVLKKKYGNNCNDFNRTLFQIMMGTKTKEHRRMLSTVWALGTVGQYASIVCSDTRAVLIAYPPPNIVFCHSCQYSCSNSSDGIRTVFSCL